jgi:hypothetical protein
MEPSTTTIPAIVSMDLSFKVATMAVAAYAIPPTISFPHNFVLLALITPTRLAT